MALEYNGQRIGAIQYNGVTIGEAMIDGQIVYRSVPPVEFPVTEYFSYTGSGGSPLVVFEHTFQEDGMMSIGGSTTYRSPDLQLWINGSRRTLSAINEGQYGTYWYTGSDIRVHPGDVVILQLPIQSGQVAFSGSVDISLLPVQ